MSLYSGATHTVAHILPQSHTTSHIYYHTHIPLLSYIFSHSHSSTQEQHTPSQNSGAATRESPPAKQSHNAPQADAMRSGDAGGGAPSPEAYFDVITNRSQAGRRPRAAPASFSFFFVRNYTSGYQQVTGRSPPPVIGEEQ